MDPQPLVPDYGGACIASIIPALHARHDGVPAWMPAAVAGASQVVLLVLDGIGWEQLRERPDLAPTLGAMAGGPITSVAPTTTATALTSITTGHSPADHGVVGYRVRVGEGVGQVLNILRWRTPDGDARATVAPATFVLVPVFGGEAVPVVTRAEFAGTGFTLASFRGARIVGYSVLSGLVYEVAALVGAGASFVYAYYDGIDRTAHEFGLDGHYDAEVRFVDRLVADLLAALPPGVALVVTSDHGQVDVGDHQVDLAPSVLRHADLVSGEARFRWLHAQPGQVDRLHAAAAAAHGDVAWVLRRQEVEEAGWFGGRLAPEVARRVGDVALVAHAPLALIDPGDAGDRHLRSRHGSLTAAEMLVPLLAEIA